jgi:hypothetical protein
VVTKAKQDCYFLTDQRLQELLDRWHETGVLPSPYTRSRLSDVVESLVRLGVNEAHSQDAIRSEMCRLMGPLPFKRFDGVERAAGHKIYQTVRYLSRRLPNSDSRHPVGAKLQQMGCCIDFFRINDGIDKFWMARLNTHSTTPLDMRLESSGEIPPVNRVVRSKGPS